MKTLRLLFVTLLLINAPWVQAHPGHAELGGFWDELLHFLMGSDHLLIVILVGLLALRLIVLLSSSSR